MSPEQKKIVAAVALASSLDGRVQTNVPTRNLWFKVLCGYDYAELHAAIELYHERPAPDRGRPVIEAPMVRKIIQEERNRSQAKHDAQRALPPGRQATVFRSRDPDGWDALVKQGRDEQREQWRRLNIPLTDWQLAHKPRPTE